MADQAGEDAAKAPTPRRGHGCPVYLFQSAVKRHIRVVAKEE